MAATSMISLQKGSDTITDFWCSSCEEDFVSEKAEFYCEMCSKFYCCKCINLHNKLFKRHISYGKKEVANWPVAKCGVDFIEKCEEHPDETLKLLCADHRQLCCNKCVMLTHRQCAKLTPISESVQTKTSSDFQQLSERIRKTLWDITMLEQRQKSNIESLHASCTNKLQKVRDMRKKINAQLDELENATIKELDEIKTNLHASLNSVVHLCSKFKAELQSLGKAVHFVKNRNEELAFMVYIKCTNKIKKYEAFLHENHARNNGSILLQLNVDIELFLSKFSGLGSIFHNKQIISVETNEVRVHPNAKYTIRGICECPNGRIIIADVNDNHVKLLDKQYKVISRCSLPACPIQMCQVSPNEVAVAVHDVQFISESKGQLVMGRTIKLSHTCTGISYLNDNLYVASKRALHQYTVSGKLVMKIYENKSEALCYYDHEYMMQEHMGLSLEMCAVNPCGEYIYVIDKRKHQLLTLTQDGKVLSTFSDSKLMDPCGVCVTPAGQVLVCYQGSNTIIQMDHEGRSKIAVLATEKDGVLGPLATCYSKNTNTLMVGQKNSCNILLIKVT